MVNLVLGKTKSVSVEYIVLVCFYHNITFIISYKTHIVLLFIPNVYPVPKFLKEFSVPAKTCVKFINYNHIMILAWLKCQTLKQALLILQKCWTVQRN